MRSKECYCELDQDGQCPGCKGAVHDKMRKIVTVQVEAAERIAKINEQSADGCSGCAFRYLDGAVAEMIRETFPRVPKVVAENQFKFLTSWLIGMGVTGVPQIMKAWDEVRHDKGWDLGADPGEVA